MLSFFRRLSKSKIGTWIMALILIAILGGFALADLSNFGTGKVGLGMSSGTLAKVGNQEVSERDLSDTMQRRLQVAREQRPDADYASIIGELNPVLDAMVDQRALMAFADKYGFPLSKRLIDAEIAQIPGTKGLDGQVNQQSYQAFLARQRMTDGQVREILAGGVLQRMILTPIATNAKITVGMAMPYASMLLETREGEAAIVPAEIFKAGLKPTDAQLQQYYSANRSTHYMVAAQRSLRIARMGPAQVAGVTASDKEIADDYNAHKATYAPSELRSVSQVVVQDQAIANGIALRARSGAAIAAAAAPAGSGAAVATLADQSREVYAGVSGAAAAAAVFGAPSGSIVGPVKSDFGWVVAKIDAVKATSGKTIDQARAEIAAKLNVDKRKTAIEDAVDKVQQALDGGSNFDEAVSAAKLPVSNTPLLTAAGTARTDPAFKLAPELAPVLKTGFSIAPNDPPEVITLGGEAGYAIVAPNQVVPASAAPLASIRDQVVSDWANEQAMQRAKAAAAQIAARAGGSNTLAAAMKGIGVKLPPARPIAARRIQMADPQGNVPPALKILFSIGAGKAQIAANPQGGGYFVVKVNKIIPGNAIASPGLITQVSSQLAEATQQDYAAQFVNDIKRDLNLKRNIAAIDAFRAKLLSNNN